MTPPVYQFFWINKTKFIVLIVTVPHSRASNTLRILQLGVSALRKQHERPVVLVRQLILNLRGSPRHLAPRRDFIQRVKRRGVMSYHNLVINHNAQSEVISILAPRNHMGFSTSARPISIVRELDRSNGYLAGSASRGKKKGCSLV